jgi:hypothetical protein
VNWKSLVRATWRFLLAGLVVACSDPAPTAPSPTALSPTAPSPTEILDTVAAETVGGVVSERTPDGIQPISDANVELFLRESDNIFDPVKVTVTGANGRYVIHLPSPGGSGATGRDGQLFEVRARKDGYRTASQSFRHVYSVWSYGGVEVSLELVGD